MDQTVFKAQVTDWRAMVDSAMIDIADDGQALNVALTDVPERRPISLPVATTSRSHRSHHGRRENHRHAGGGGACFARTSINC